MASVVTQCPGNALFNTTAPAMQGVAVTQNHTPHVAAAPAYSAPIITASSSGNLLLLTLVANSFILAETHCESVFIHHKVIIIVIILFFQHLSLHVSLS